MHGETSDLGNEFSNWSALTDEYMKGMHALRRREPGASARMMEIARLMSQYQQLMATDGVITVAPREMTQTPAPRKAHNWLKSAAATLFRAGNSPSLAH